MNVSAAPAYIRTIIETAAPQLSEWTDGFNVDNIPESIFNNKYHLLMGDFGSGALNDQLAHTTVPVEMKIFLKGFNSVQATIESGCDLANTIRLEAIKPSNAFVGTNLKNVIVTSVFPETTGSNDNLVIINMSYEFLMLFCP